MKAKNLLFIPVLLLCTVFIAIAQRPSPTQHLVKDIIPFGQKLPAPDLTKYQGKFPPGLNIPGLNTTLRNGMKLSDPNAIKKDADLYMQQLLKTRKLLQASLRSNATAPGAKEGSESLDHPDFHLTRDINALAESNPANNKLEYPSADSYAILNNVIYFAADDGIHGNELWRSDGTAEGTYIVKDIEPGLGSGLLQNDINDITATNGKLYFSAITSAYGLEPWVSDGTESGTQLLMDIHPGPGPSSPIEFVAVGNDVYFVTDGYSFSAYWDAIWKTNGTTAGTMLVKDFGTAGLGSYILAGTESNGLLFFTLYDNNSGFEPWRSDGTDEGTYLLKDIGPFEYSSYPNQMTKYNNHLYFSADDGTGRKLWVTDGTVDGTIYAPGNPDVLIEFDYWGIKFPIMNNVLYIPGSTPSTGNGLYKYDAHGTAGLVLVKDLTTGTDPDFIVPSEMVTVNNKLYFKVSNSNGGVHDELWSSKGNGFNTWIVKKFQPGETARLLTNGNGTLYFVKSDTVYGTELWKSGSFPFGTELVSDIFKGATSSYPAYLTAFRGKLFFSAANNVEGNELFMTEGTDKSTALVKDINTVSTTGSSPANLVAWGNNVLFTAYERVHGYEFYRSDGTAPGTELLNDIVPGEGSGYGYGLSKNNTFYFITFPENNTTSIYETNGKKNGLRKITPDYSRYQYYILELHVADNGMVFYSMSNFNTGTYELWRTDGTDKGNILLSSTLYYYDYLNVVGNTAFFVAGNEEHGYELWKSDGSQEGTVMVKDINLGVADSAPGGMFAYNNEVYFDAYDGTSTNYSFWKSDGTEAGTVKLREIIPALGYDANSTALYFCISNNILYFSAIDYSDTKGQVLWKTNGSVSGTRPVKDIDPGSSEAYPAPWQLTDVNGTLFFIADDGVHGEELWKSNGTEKSTKLVKDNTPGIDGSFAGSLTSLAGKLFFAKYTDGKFLLWTSNGEEKGTKQVDDPGISNVDVSSIIAAGNKLFVTGFTHRYGDELYAGIVDNNKETFEMAAVSDQIGVKTIGSFNATLYPNPATSKATLQISGNAKDVSVSITDVSGKKLWRNVSNHAMLINLPTEKMAAGIYIVTVTTGKETKILKLVKQ